MSHLVTESIDIDCSSERRTTAVRHRSLDARSSGKYALRSLTASTAFRVDVGDAKEPAVGDGGFFRCLCASQCWEGSWGVVYPLPDRVRAQPVVV